MSKVCKIVNLDNIHTIVPTFISYNKIIISNYEDIMDVILSMIRSGHVFTIDRDLLS